MSQVFGVILGVILAISGGLYIYSRQFIARIEQEHPPIGKFVEVEGTRLHVLDVGQGPAVVLIHGASGNLHDFKSSIVDELAKTYRVLAFDRPGLGYSDPKAGPDWCGPDCQARLIHGAVASLGISKAVVLGHSWGGAVAMAYGLDYPDEVQGVVDLSGATHPWTGPTSWLNTLPSIPVAGPIAVNLLLAPLSHFLVEPSIVATFRPNPPTADYRKLGAVDLILRGNNFSTNALNSVNLRQFNAVQAKRYPDFKPRLIILTGADDPIVPSWNHAQRLKAQLPDAELIELPGIGHMPHHIAPDQVIGAIKRLWDASPGQ